MFDELRFKQILANLISNAIKFSDKGIIEINFNIQKISAISNPGIPPSHGIHFFFDKSSVI